MKSVVVLAAFGLLVSLAVTGCDSEESNKPTSSEPNKPEDKPEDKPEEKPEEKPSGSTKSLGEDCTESSECKEDKCVKFTDNDGNKRGFCSRICTKSEDCPESGWECNLSPFTACVPAKN